MNASDDDLPPPPARPFQVRLRSSEGDEAAGAAASRNAPEGETEIAEDPELTLEEIEAAYLRALDTADAADALLPALTAELLEGDDALAEASDKAPASAAESPSAAPNRLNAFAHAADATTADSEPAADDDPRVTQTQVIEALLFVGGAPLSSKRLAEILGGSATAEQVDALLDELNHQYLDEQRPYEIRLGDGGSRLQLREAFEPIRRKVYGQGPREVKLGQDALEVLAFVAYQQPVTRDDVEETGKEQAGAVLRQLLRRELVQLERGVDGDADRYRTTARFLELFGLRSLADLPRSRSFDFK